MDGMYTDFTKRGDEAAMASFGLNAPQIGQLGRVGGSFAGIDQPLNLTPDNNGGDANTVWGIQTQAQRLGGGGPV